MTEKQCAWVEEPKADTEGRMRTTAELDLLEQIYTEMQELKRR